MRSTLFVCLMIMCGGLAAAGQSQAPGGLVVTGPSPWVDVTAPPYSALCNGGLNSTDDTSAIQSALNAIDMILPTGSALFIPPTTNGCMIKGTETTIYAASNAACSGSPYVCVATITLNATSKPTNFPPLGGLINVHNVPLGASPNYTNYNGTFQIITEGTTIGTCAISGNYCITFDIGSYTGAADSVTIGATSNAVAEIGLYFAGSNLKVIGAANGSASTNLAGSPLGGSLLVTNQPITILTTMTTGFPHSGPDIQNVSFYDTAGAAYAGLDVALTSGFNVSNSGFYNFTASSTPASADPQGGAGIVATGGQPSGFDTAPWVEYGKIQNNNMEQVRFGFTSRFKVSSVTFDSNTVVCQTGPDPSNGVGLDIGGTWFLNYFNATAGLTQSYNSTGGENRVINQQTQTCLIGTLLGAQNTDRVEEKLENDGSGTCSTGAVTCAIGLALLDTDDSTLYEQSKYVATGLYIDHDSPNNSIYEARSQSAQAGSANGQKAITALCPSPSTCANGRTYLFNSASVVVDPNVSSGTALFGTPSAGTFVPTSNSTFTADNEPTGLNATVASGSRVTLTVHGDGASDDIFDAYSYPNASTGPALSFSLSSTGIPTVGNHGYITALGGVPSGGQGSGYAVGDIVGVPGPGSGATAVVLKVNSSGAVAMSGGLSLLTGGTGYTSSSSAVTLTTITGSGSGVKVSSTTASTTGTTGQINLVGGTSGTAEITAPSAAGTPVLTLPNATGTFATAFSGDGVLLSSTTSGASAAGTLTDTLANQSANVLLAGPTSGTAAAPTFRSLVAADLPALTLFINEQSGGVATSDGITSSNTTKLWGILVPYRVTFGHILWNVAAADTSSSDKYDIGIYDSGGNLVADTGPLAGGTGNPWNATGNIAEAIAQTTATIGPGRYYLGFTGTATTGKFGAGTGVNPLSNTAPSSGGTTTLGQLNASITPPADSYVNAAGAIPMFVLY